MWAVFVKMITLDDQCNISHVVKWIQKHIQRSSLSPSLSLSVSWSAVPNLWQKCCHDLNVDDDDNTDDYNSNNNDNDNYNNDYNDVASKRPARAFPKMRMKILKLTKLMVLVVLVLDDGGVGVGKDDGSVDCSVIKEGSRSLVQTSWCNGPLCPQPPPLHAWRHLSKRAQGDAMHSARII